MRLLNYEYLCLLEKNLTNMEKQEKVINGPHNILFNKKTNEDPTKKY